jgi:lipase (class 3)
MLRIQGRAPFRTRRGRVAVKKGEFQSTPRAVPVLFGSGSSLGPSFPSPKADQTYDAKWAYALAVISGWAYAEGQVLVDQLQYYGFAKCTVTEIGVSNPAMLIVATAYFVRSADKRVGVLAFRGTEPMNLVNWLTDADTSKYTFGSEHVHVHSGFFANVEALWGDIVDVVHPAIENGLEELYLTGHSLGGAMAVVAAARIFNDDVPMYQKWRSALRGIYTYGQPIVGDTGFKAKFDGFFGAFLYRHIYDDDVVPCLPPTSVDSTFVHFGQRRAAATPQDSWALDPYDRRAGLLAFASIAESFLTRRIDALHGVKVPYSLDDHSPRGYIDVSRNSLNPATSRAVALKPARPAMLGRLFWKAIHLRPLSS